MGSRPQANAWGIRLIIIYNFSKSNKLIQINQQVLQYRPNTTLNYSSESLIISGMTVVIILTLLY